MTQKQQDNESLHAPRPRTIRWSLNRFLTPLLVLGAGLVVIFGVGIAQKAGWISAGGATPKVSNTSTAQVHTCPMHPQIRQPGPGRCPICGMPLVPATASGGEGLDEFSIKIEPAQRRLANIQVTPSVREPVFATIRTVGAIAIDESRMATIASYIDGRIERLFADYTGVVVSKGDHLAVVYSPELYAAQVEYLESRKSFSNTSSTLEAVRQAQQKLVASSRHKLVELGLREDQIKTLESTEKAESRLTIYAPTGGTVIEKVAVEGKYIKAGEPIYRIADLSTVWLMLELFPEDAARIRFGQRVEAEVQSRHGEVFKGRVAFIAPTVDPQKRTVGIRVEFLNTAGTLRPGDYANATITLPIGQLGEVYDADLAGRWISPMHPQIISDDPGQCPICGMDLVSTSRYGYSETPVEQPSSLYVPRSAVLMAGSNSVLYVEAEPGRFEIRSIVMGPILNDKVIILAGLKEGENVATAGNFLIDSQMQLAGKPSLIDPTRAIVEQLERKVPLEFSDIKVASIGGEAGEILEELFAAYFRIQKALAADTKPTETDATSLHKNAVSLQQNSELPPAAVAQFNVIAKHSEHLRHMELEKARHDAFRPISHAIVSLSTLVRGDAATTQFHHVFCPMVKGGSGDWLQDSGGVLNPYWGSGMLHCGEDVRTFPLSGGPTPSTEHEHDHDHDHDHGDASVPKHTTAEDAR
jgi:membrane fusion protein, copper/silver efflux system